MLRLWMVIGVLAAATTCSLGFVVDRSAAATWDTAPSLDAEQRTSFDRVMNGKMQVTGMEKVLQASDSKKSVKHGEEPSPEEPSRKKRSELVVVTSDNVSCGTKAAKQNKQEVPLEENPAVATKETSVPKNVVLLLIDEAGQDRETLWKNFKAKHLFPVQGFLQSCRNADLMSERYALDDAITSGRKDKSCECEHFLRTNIGALLSWARHAKEMTTGAVSATNFTIPAALGYEAPIGIAKEFDDAEENSLKREVRHSKPELRDAWRLIDLDKQPGAPPVTLPPLSAKQDGMAGYDGMWDVFDMFSRIRIAFFRTLLDSLGGNLGGPDDEFSPRRPFALQPSLVELVGDTIKELKSVSNDKGYMLVAAAPGNELSSAVDLLQRETSPKDTLLVLAGICAADKKPVPFYASGPGAKALHGASTVWDLPGAVENAVTGGCHGAGCRNRRHEQPSALLLPVPAPILSPASQPDIGPAHKRIARQDATTSSEAPAGGDAKKGCAGELTVDAMTTFLSVATSIIAMFTLKS